MKRIFMSLFPLAMLLMALAVPAAAAPVTWNLSNVTFSDGGSGTGSFVLNGATITDWSIAVTDPNLPYTFDSTNGLTVATVMTPAPIPNNPTITYYEFYAPNANLIPDLYFAFTSPLVAPGPVTIPAPIWLVPPSAVPALYSKYFYGVTSTGYEWANIVSGELTTSGTATAVPEPATMLLLGSGLLGLWGFRKKFIK